jgi:hypothetical protein
MAPVVAPPENPQVRTGAWLGTSVSRRNRTKVLVEPVLDYLSDTQVLTGKPLTSDYY